MADYRVATVLEEKNSRTFQELFKDFQPTFPDPFWRRFTKLFNDGGFRHYLICLVSYKNRII